MVIGSALGSNAVMADLVDKSLVWGSSKTYFLNWHQCHFQWAACSVDDHLQGLASDNISPFSCFSAGEGGTVFG